MDLLLVTPRWRHLLIISIDEQGRASLRPRCLSQKLAHSCVTRRIYQVFTCFDADGNIGSDWHRTVCKSNFFEWLKPIILPQFQYVVARFCDLMALQSEATAISRGWCLVKLNPSPLDQQQPSICSIKPILCSRFLILRMELIHIQTYNWHNSTITKCWTSMTSYAVLVMEIYFWVIPIGEVCFDVN